MVDIPTIATALNGIKSATDIAKYLKQADASLETAETKLKIAELIEQLAEAKMAMADINEIIFEKDREIAELKKALEVSGKLHYEAPYYWLEENGKKDGPFCQQCYENNRKLIHLHSPHGGGFWVCKTCKSDYLDKNYIEEGSLEPENYD